MVHIQQKKDAEYWIAKNPLKQSLFVGGGIIHTDATIRSTIWTTKSLGPYVKNPDPRKKGTICISYGTIMALSLGSNSSSVVNSHTLVNSIIYKIKCNEQSHSTVAAIMQ